MMWPSATTPTNWLLCNGQSFSSSEYPDLYSILGSSYVPDFRGRMPIGAGTTIYSVNTSNNYSRTSQYIYKGTLGGTDVYKIQPVQAPPHRHYVPADGNYPGGTWDVLDTSTAGDDWSGDGGGWGKTMLSSYPTIHNEDSRYGWIDNMPPYYGIYFIIKAK